MSNTPTLTLLDQSPGQVLADHEALDRLAQAICLDRGCDYLEALELFEGTSRAQQESGASHTVRDVLGVAGVNLDAVSSDLKLLSPDRAVKTAPPG